MELFSSFDIDLASFSEDLLQAEESSPLGQKILIPACPDSSTNLKENS